MSKKFLANFADSSEEDEHMLNTDGSPQKANDSRELLDKVIEMNKDVSHQNKMGAKKHSLNKNRSR